MEQVADAEKRYREDNVRVRFDDISRWTSEATEIRDVNETLAVWVDPAATSLMRDMARFEARGKVRWNPRAERVNGCWLGNWQRPPRRHIPRVPRRRYTADEIIQRFDVRGRSSSNLSAVCPAHQDRNPSLSLRVTDDRVLVFCHRGCEVAEIVAAVGLEVRDLFLEST